MLLTTQERAKEAAMLVKVLGHPVRLMVYRDSDEAPRICKSRRRLSGGIAFRG